MFAKDFCTKEEIDKLLITTGGNMNWKIDYDNEVDAFAKYLEDQASEPTDTEATIMFLESIIEDQAYQIEALQIRIKELDKST